MNHGRFTECCFLRSIGRDLLSEFFRHFERELAEAHVVLPTADQSDDIFFSALSRILLSPEGLPDRVNDVLHEIQELSTEEGHGLLVAALEQKGMPLLLAGDPTPEELALRVWLLDPELTVRKYNEQRFARLKACDFFERANDCLQLEAPVKGLGCLDSLVQRLDSWFVRHGRGDENTLVEKYDIKGEHLFLIRHGDTYFRSARIEKRKVEVLHYRPAKDDVVVYCPQRDELRIYAKTKGEKELYRRAFGEFLHGFEHYFRKTKTYTLEPLRQLGAEALGCDDIPGISRVVLTQLELALATGRNQRKTFEADDVFACSWTDDPGAAKGLILPETAILTEAAFHLYVGNVQKPIEVRIKPPNTIRLGKQGAVHCVHEWLNARGFKPTVKGS